MTTLDSTIQYFGKKYLHAISAMMPVTRHAVYQNQEMNLVKLKRNLKGTKIYEDLRLSEVTSYREYLDQVPVWGYEQYAPYVDSLLSATPRALFNDPIEYFGLSSGTSGANSKRVPYNDAMISLFQKAQRRVAARLTELEPEMNILAAERLTFGSSPFLYEENGIKFGYVSGVLSTKVPSLLAKKTFPSSAVLEISDWDQKIEALIGETVDKNIQVVSGIPTYLISIFEAILQKTGRQTIGEIWPQLTVFIFAATPINQYRDRIDQLVGRKMRYYGLYAATEAPIGIPYSNFSKSSQKYLLNPDLLVSFNPVEGSSRPLGVHEVEIDTPYFINIGTPNGFVHYCMKDVIKFSEVPGGGLAFEFVGRKATGINLAAEKTSDDQILDAIQEVKAHLNMDVRHFFLSPLEVNGKNCYQWTLFVSEGAHSCEEEIARALDRAMGRLNEDYAECRHVEVLGAPFVRVMTAHNLQGYFERNRSRGQFKMKTTFETGEEFTNFMKKEILC